MNWRGRLYIWDNIWVVEHQLAKQYLQGSLNWNGKLQYESGGYKSKVEE